MIDWPLVLIILIAVVVLGGLLWVAAWWYPPVDLPGPAPDDTLHGAGESSSDVMDKGRWVKEFTNGIETPWVRTGEDDDWADQLHAINQQGYLRHLSLVTRGEMGDLTRPVAHMTHYEVEALIRTLAVPEWVPDRYRMAA